MANVYFSDQVHTLHALNPTDGSERWIFSQGDHVSRAVAVGSLVYVGASDGVGSTPTTTLYALDSGTGAVVWSAPGGIWTVANGAVYVADFVNHRIDCRDAATGVPRWQQQAQGNDLTITSDTVYVWTFPIPPPGPLATVSSSLTAINTADGTIRWTFARDNEQFGVPVAGDAAVYVASTTLHYPDSPSERIYALKATDGSQLWNAGVPKGTDVFALAGGILYAGSSSTGLGISAYRTSDGALLWKNADSLVGGFTAVGNAVYVATYHGTVIELDAGTGRQLWAVTTGKPGTSQGTPLVANGILYVVGDVIATSNSMIMAAIDGSTGVIVWQHKMDISIGALVIAAGVVYTYGLRSPTVWAFSAANGVERWQVHTSQIPFSPLTVTNGVSGA